MKKILNDLKGKVSMVNVMNTCALLVAAYTINVTCFWVHHQPEVPEEAKRLRKF
jgi:cyclic lactone autoinducer peptide